MRNSWQVDSKFAFSKVRLPADAAAADVAIAPDALAVGMELEVFSRSSENEDCGWWCAVVKMMRGEFLVVEYSGCNNRFTEIVNFERIRVKNVNPPIDSKTFFKYEIEVPEDVRE